MVSQTVVQEPRVPLTADNADYGLHEIEQGELQVRGRPLLSLLAGVGATGGALMCVLGAWGVQQALVPWGIAIFLLLGPAFLGWRLLGPLRPALPPAANQHELARALRTRMALYRRVNQAAVASIWLALLVAGAASFLQETAIGRVAVGVAAIVLLIGAAAWGSVNVRRGDTLELARQTAILQRLEATGLAPAGTLDIRVRQVLERLDEVLADVPDSTLQRFLESEESSLYLELLAEARDQ